MDQAKTYEDDWDVAYEAAPTAAVETPPARAPAALPSQSDESHRAAEPPSAPEAAQADPEQSAWMAAPVPHRKRANAFPAFTARSALFRATQADGAFDSLTPIQAQGAKIQVLGPKLDMRDKRVWEIAIELAKSRASNIGERFEIELRQFARRMGNEQPNSRALQAIWSSLSRLAMARVAFEIDGGKVKGIGSLLASATKDGNRFFIRLNPDFALPALLCDRQFDFNADRRASIRSSLGQWLHDFYCTHSAARPIDLGYLMGLCGYDGPPKNFPARVRTAMDELVAAAPGVVEAYAIVQPTKRAEDWVLEARIGPEKRAYQQPAALPSATRRTGKAAL